MSIRNRIAICTALFCTTTGLRAETWSMTGIGLGSRTVTFTAESTNETTGATTAVTSSEELTGIGVCHKVSASTSFALELQGGGCILPGGLKTFTQVVSTNVGLAYYFGASRTQALADSGTQMRVVSPYAFYVLGMAGFSKSTVGQIEQTNFSFVVDTMDFGGGAGGYFRLSRSISIGGEAFYTFGSVLSTAVKGSVTTLFAMSTLNVSI